MAHPLTSTLTVPSQFALIGTPSTPGPSDRLAARIAQIGLQNDLPAQWGGNRHEQLAHFTGVVSIAIRPFLDQLLGAKFNVWQRRKPARDGVISKAMGEGQYESDDEYEPADPDHPLCKILESPGGEDGAWSMQQECSYLMLQKLLTGDAPAWLPRNEQGKPVQFYALTGSSVQANTGTSPDYPNGSYRVLGTAGGTMWFAGYGATSAVLPGEEVRCYRDPHPFYRNLGMSRLQCGALEVDVLEAITRSRWSYFDQGLQLDTIIYLPGADKATCDKTAATLTQKHGGSRNSRKVAVVGGAGAFDTSGKPLTVQQLGQGAREMDFTSSYEQAVKVVLALFKVPGLLAGMTESGSSYAADWAAQQRFWDLAIVPEMRGLGAYLTQNLAKPWCEYDGQFKIEVEIAPPTNIEEQGKERQFAVQQGITDVNEYRRETGRKPKPDGDMPLAAYVAKTQQAVAPPPAPAQMPGGTGQETAPEGATNDDVPQDGQAITDAAEGQGGANADTPEGAQDALTQAALQALGLDQSQEQPDAIAKAVQAQPRKQRSEGEKWQVGDKWYTKRGGKTVGIANPNKAAPAAGESSPTKPGQQPAAPANGTQPAAHPAIPGGDHDAAAKAMLAGNSFIRKHTATGPHAIRDGASLKRFLDAGGQLDADDHMRIRSAQMRQAARSLPQTPTVQQAASTAPQWAAQAAEKHVDAVAQHFGISREQAHRLLVKAITAVGQHAAQSVTIRDKTTGKTATLARKPAGGAPQNPSGAGALPQRLTVAKGLISVNDVRAGQAYDWHDPAPYGYCPECREPGICCERRINGNVHCANEHAYPRKEAKYACAMIDLKGATAKALKALGKQIADEDLGEDGRETDPHVTARYGLHVDAALPVEEAVRGFGPVSLRLGALKAFRGAESGKDYDVIYADVESPDLHRLHEALGALPHTDTHATYHPHATIAYVKAGLADKYLAQLEPLDAEEQATAVQFSTAKREHTEIPLVERKAMSALDDSTGGFLVPPAEMATRKKKRKRDLVDRVLKSLGTS